MTMACPREKKKKYNNNNKTMNWPSNENDNTSYEATKLRSNTSYEWIYEMYTFRFETVEYAP